MKHKYLITYQDRHEQQQKTFIRAKSKEDAIERFYKKDKYSIISKVYY